MSESTSDGADRRELDETYAALDAMARDPHAPDDAARHVPNVLLTRYEVVQILEPAAVLLGRAASLIDEALVADLSLSAIRRFIEHAQEWRADYDRWENGDA